jgi:uncharacterized protein YecT (DUF1311 family)
MGSTISVGPTFMVGLRFFVVVFYVIACIVPAQAQPSSVYDACIAKAMTQTAITSCAAEELTRAGRALNIVYAKLIRAVADRPETLAKVRTAERAWITYRDAYLEAVFPAKAKQAEYGSIYLMEADQFLADLTRQQTIALTYLLKAHSGCGLNAKIGCAHPSSQ